MTGKDYERIAEIIRSIKEYDPEAGYHTDAIAWVFAEEFMRDDPLFLRASFLAACEGR